MTLHPLLEEWTLWQLAARRSEVTVNERVRVLTQFANESQTSIVAAKPIDLVRWLSRHTEWSASTAATYHSYLRAWFNWLCLMDHRDDNPMIKLASPKYPERVPRPVSDDGLIRLLTLRMHHRTRVMILLAALAGLRVSEVAKVRGEDIDLSAPALYVEGKGGKRAMLPLHPLLVDAAATMTRRGWWFPGNARRLGDHILGKSVSDIIGQAMRRGGVRGDQVHDFRVEGDFSPGGGAARGQQLHERVFGALAVLVEVGAAAFHDPGDAVSIAVSAAGQPYTLADLGSGDFPVMPDS